DAEQRNLAEERKAGDRVPLRARSEPREDERLSELQIDDRVEPRRALARKGRRYRRFEIAHGRRQLDRQISALRVVPRRDRHVGAELDALDGRGERARHGKVLLTAALERRLAAVAADDRRLLQHL